MADYWKSNPRKFCEFCKCWFADNKSSKEFHERGKRHKENVAKKIGELTKKGQKQYETQKELGSFLKQMEEGAMKAFKKDVTENPTLIPEYKVALVEKRVREAQEEPIPLPGSRYEPSQSPATSGNQPSTATPTATSIALSSKAQAKNEWVEAVSPEGHKYFWNTVTGASQWDKPEHFVPADGSGQKEENTSQNSSSKKDSKPTTSSKAPPTGKSEWIAAVSPEGHKYYWNTVTGASQWEKPENFTPPEQQKETDKQNDTEEASSSKNYKDEGEDEEKTPSRGVKRRSDAYGGWTTVSTEETPDLELPEANPQYASMYMPQAAQFEPREELGISEKIVGSIGGGQDGDASVSFKKRKVGGRQIRSRDTTS